MMKKKIIGSLILGLGAMLVVCSRNQNQSDHSAGGRDIEPKSRDVAPPSTSAEYIPSGLKLPLLRRTKENWKKDAQALATFLTEWNPVGHSVDELKKNVGPPSREDSDIVSYQFDSGLNGCVFDFKVKDGKIVSTELIGY
ncbi:hypothetical protein [Prosthecobacter sp.]|uniref:hypothetical protein n=1 Tax=Prosthecobacter sp. TaxID=1965333 RepID=UPI003784AD95